MVSVSSKTATLLVLESWLCEGLHCHLCCSRRSCVTAVKVRVMANQTQGKLQHAVNLNFHPFGGHISPIWL